MINTILLENESGKLDSLKSKIEQYCPFLEVTGTAQTFEDARQLVHYKVPELAFVNPVFPFMDLMNTSNGTAKPEMELIFVSNSPDYTLNAIQFNAAGYLFRPLQDEAFMTTVSKARDRILFKEESKRNRLLLEKLLCEKRANELIGIPTIEGLEFITAKEIVRCEGLQKCTRVVTVAKTDIVSSYNIGEFITLLEPYCFFSPHKSHLINLAYIRRYLREGTIVMQDNSIIPVSKRKKCEFLDRVVHL